MNAATVARTLGNAILLLFFCFALFVVARRFMHAWNVGDTGERIVWLLVMLGTAALVSRALRRTLNAARNDR
jgi:hypothetical protein